MLIHLHSQATTMPKVRAAMGCLLGEYIYGLAYGAHQTHTVAPFRAMVKAPAGTT